MSKVRCYRVNTYIDGFNLYHGMRESGWHDCFWLNIVELSNHLTKGFCQLVAAKYFTARIRGARDGDASNRAKMREAKRKRQSDYLEALSELPGLHIYEGFYKPGTVTCKRCGHSWDKPEEKKTDVQIATQLMDDAYSHAFDTAILVSGDGDMAPPMEVVRRRFPDKRLIAAFPPARYNRDIARLAYTSFEISRKQLRSSQLANPFKKRDSSLLRKPESW